MAPGAMKAAIIITHKDLKVLKVPKDLKAPKVPKDLKDLKDLKAPQNLLIT